MEIQIKKKYPIKYKNIDISKKNFRINSQTSKILIIL